MSTTTKRPVLDEEAFVRKVPYPLIPTNIPGAFTTPAPPDDLDPNAASQEELTRHGLLWRKPRAGDPPSMAAAWEKVFGRRWESKDRITPHIEPQPGKTHVLKNLKKTDANYTSTAWSGCALEGGPWTTVLGQWAVPTVSKPTEPQGTEGGWNSSSWLGIDGFFISNDVLQAGVQQKVNSAGQASYVAWYEWFVPGPYTQQELQAYPYIFQANIPNFPVSPGQTVYCSVQYVSKTAGAIYFANDITGQHFSITLMPPTGANFNGSTMEWIMEAPDGGEPTSSIPKFTPVNFTSAFGCSGSTVGNPQNGNIVNLVNTSGKPLTSVSLASDEVTIDFIG